MKILLIQSEIEQAIRDYMNQQINVKEGMTLDIDLRSTRGSEGFTADIDIRMAGDIKVAVKAAAAEPDAVKVVPPTAVAEVEEKSADPVAESTAEPKKSLFSAVKKTFDTAPIGE